MKLLLLLLFFSLHNVVVGQEQIDVNNVDLSMKSISHHDSLFWEAYNHCDVDAMSKYFTDDMEFYHDKGGLTQSKVKFIETVKKGMCGNADWRLRREAIAGTVHVFPLKDVGGLISGEHVFYITKKDEDEFLDGYGKFLQVWKVENNQWKMYRILSYDHGPAKEKLKK